MEIVHDYSQYRALRKAPGVRRLVDEKARNLQLKAESLGKGSYDVSSGAPGGADRWRAFVATGDVDARRDNAKNDTLLRALGGGGV